MSDKLSIFRSEEIKLEAGKADRAASFIKAVANITPFVGPLIAEVVAFTIPNQKEERVITFLKVLSDKVKYIEEDLLQNRMKTEGFTDLLEDALYQASRALSQERREYLASLLKNSLTSNELDQVGQKKLLALLNELNDVEIIVLEYEALPDVDREVFEQKHKTILVEPRRIYFEERDDQKVMRRPTQEQQDRAVLLDHYEKKLLEVGLLQPVAVNMDGRPNEVSPLGHLLLRYIDLAGTKRK